MSMVSSMTQSTAVLNLLSVSSSPRPSTKSLRQFVCCLTKAVQCALDPLPTAQLKAVIDVIAPFLTDLFNKSLSTGRVPGAFKAEYITPLVKKLDMDPEDVRSYHPVSNL